MSSHEPGSFRVREFARDDFRAICGIDQLCFSEAIAYTPQEMSLGLAQRGAFAYVAESGGNLVAFVLACQKKRHVGHIVTIDILPEFRRKGLGRTFMELAERRFREKGAARVVLEVNIQNESAFRFYEEMGYTTTRLLASYYPDGSDAWLMEKALD